MLYKYRQYQEEGQPITLGRRSLLPHWHTGLRNTSPGNPITLTRISLPVHKDNCCSLIYLFGCPWWGPPAGFGDLTTGWHFGHRVFLSLVGGQWRRGGKGWRTDSYSHVFCAGEAQAAQVLVCLTVHHQQPGFKLYCLDPLHHLRTNIAEQLWCFSFKLKSFKFMDWWPLQCVQWMI